MFPSELEKKPRDHPQAKDKNLTCGTCQWFSAGFKGGSCRKLRGVEISSIACVEYTERLKDVFHEITQDKYIQGIKDSFNHPRWKIDTSLLEELRGYIISDDLLSKRYGTQQDLEAVAVALKKVIAYRSRVSTIYTSILDLHYELKELQSHINLWLYSKYAKVRELKNDTMRKAAIERLVPEMVAVQKDIDKTLALAKYLDEKLGENDWTLRAILSSAEKLWYSTSK